MLAVPSVEFEVKMSRPYWASEPYFELDHQLEIRRFVSFPFNQQQGHGRDARTAQDVL